MTLLHQRTSGLCRGSLQFPLLLASTVFTVECGSRNDSLAFAKTPLRVTLSVTEELPFESMVHSEAGEEVLVHWFSVPLDNNRWTPLPQGVWKYVHSRDISEQLHLSETLDPVLQDASGETFTAFHGRTEKPQSFWRTNKGLWVRSSEAPRDAVLQLPVIGGRRCLTTTPPEWRVSVSQRTSVGLGLRPNQEVHLEWNGPAHQISVRTGFLSLVEWGRSDGSAEFVVDDRRGNQIASFSLGEETDAEPVTRQFTVSPDWRRVRMRVRGPPGLYTLHLPRAIHASSASQPRPSVLLFVADTFRADAMGVHGNSDELTPCLDAFAAENVWFERAWAPSSWTLPSVSSLLLGVYPPQHGAVRTDTPPSRAIPALSEEFRRAGYRTGAVTGSLFVSARYGLDRGFEWFEEQLHATPEETSERVRRFLESRDHRPFFLLVHTYHNHGLYEPTPQALQDHGDKLGIQYSARELDQLVVEHLARTNLGRVPRRHIPLPSLLKALELQDNPCQVLESVQLPRGGSFLEHQKRLHRACAADIDRLFGNILDDLQQTGHGQTTYVVFTSDHGEGFGEHGQFGHGAGPWEEILRVPLLIGGPGLAPTQREDWVSTVHLAASLLELADLTPPTIWKTKSLFDRYNHDQPVFIFEEFRDREATLAIVDQGIKYVIARDSLATGIPRFLHAFDLNQDPGELQDLVNSRQQELKSMLGPYVDLARASMRPLGNASPLVLNEQDLRNLEALGYAVSRQE